jgi:hypothetical protein
VDLVDLGEITIFYDYVRITGMHFRNRKDKLIGAFGRKRFTDLNEFKELEDYPKEDPRS